MSKDKHTPKGKLHHHSPNYNDVIHIHIENDSQHYAVADCLIHDAQNKDAALALAKLFVASPALLSACEDILYYLVHEMEYETRKLAKLKEQLTTAINDAKPKGKE